MIVRCSPFRGSIEDLVVVLRIALIDFPSLTGSAFGFFIIAKDGGTSTLLTHASVPADASR